MWYLSWHAFIPPHNCMASGNIHCPRYALISPFLKDIVISERSVFISCKLYDFLGYYLILGGIYLNVLIAGALMHTPKSKESSLWDL